MKSPKAIILGWINVGNIAQCGETVKNQHIIEQLRSNGCKVTTLDFCRWRKEPMVLVKTACALLFHPHTPLILSTAPKNVYFLMKLHYRLRSPRKIIHWVIGGNLHKLIADGTFDKKYINALHVNIVESGEMYDTMKAMGIENVIHIPNFKPITYKPALKPHTGKTRFVFMSRVMPEKGADYILQSIQRLNNEGLADRFEVDFYGKIQDDYTDTFTRSVDKLQNARYKGFLDFSKKESYDTLSEYSAMLFPTYWKSEGFSGVFIDAFIAGLPLIASDWNHNFQIQQEGKTAIKIPVHDVDALTDAMRDVITGKTDLEPMRQYCQLEAEKYNVSTIISPEFMHKIGI